MTAPTPAPTPAPAAAPASAPVADLPLDFGADPDAATEAATFVTFDLGAQTFAADVACVREILDLQPLSPLPNAPRDLLGMIDVRGEGLAVLDLADRLGFAARGADAGDARILVLERAGQAPVGVIADRVRDVLEIPPDQVDPPPAIPGGWRPEAVHGVARLDGRIAYVLDLDAILAPNDAALDFG